MSSISERLFNNIFGREFSFSSDTISDVPEKTMGASYAKLKEEITACAAVMETLPREELEVVSHDGLHLKGYLFRNDVPTDKTAICVHGYHSTGFVDFASIGLEYLRRGFNLLLPINRACGESEGEWTTFGIHERNDTTLWVDMVSKLFPGGEIVLHGCSMGGSTVCMMADKELPGNVRAIVSDCAFSDINEEFAHMLQLLAHLPRWPILNSIEKQFKKRIGVGFSEYYPLKSVKNARYPMFFVHGEDDSYVPPQNSEKLYAACPTDKRLLIIPGYGHAAAHLAGNSGYYGPIFEFLGRHMTLPNA